MPQRVPLFLAAWPLMPFRCHFICLATAAKHIQTNMSTPMADTSLNFPHPKLTPINGKPSFNSLRKFQKELYANAHTIDSTLGGGRNGHLAPIMPDADYLACTGEAYIAPVHPGAQPAHGAGTTAVQITEANRQYDALLGSFKLHRTMQNALRKQILAAIDNKYLMTLEDPDLGYIVSPQTMLAHLKDTYGSLTPNEIEANHATLLVAWNPDEPIEDLWLCIHNAQTLATSAGEPILDASAMCLTLHALESTGVFDSALHDWHIKNEANKMLDNFKFHFNSENEEWLHKLTAQMASYHGAHTAVETPTTTTTGSNIASGARVVSTPINSGPPQHGIHLNNNVTMYSCWSHGLGKNPAHTSTTCNNHHEGHREEATTDNMHVGW